MGVLMDGRVSDQCCRAGEEIDLGIPVRVPRAGEGIFRLAAQEEELGWAGP